ncbi:UDP-N-acetylglucosamine 1-carboxyvinyltransferase [Faecalicoccus acidiformans]|uniref:UDP-N-acetylglucosamine 1-carboxyvinyltransferase n=1 Tax=Faecalicoccus acidiformans TaxID=915173 RepID=A0A7W8D336_9FIRM|nr:UDP-N-acetylglucosamine 1-carboxyvinyltransferase [Faecalicoccus acidiformans]MBB5185089.1 UDP-N-acetylglucosamine 1-carboxyvinyltransferase [Faecalicoccus acidiformans]MBM6830548.1 UDP-N-acetylglucosamine 1-carboxyvinyltransferase [Faecalicoccus acidiformans]MDM8203037.1 UDP-N-acetylglucosamine 1-carboxyvinyltransferase [Faecalicoccus acidiformans]HIW18606.1 UDP-N-acetylglucosamine 1-carboxyvinyltransferase [Candidatus Faecalicoccus intestinipullorum]
MEEVIKIEGGHPLEGSVRISGSKNATVALIPACVLANEPITIFDVPNISDVKSLKVLLEELDVIVEQKDDDTLYIDPSKMVNRPMTSTAVSKLRASYYFMGALLGKFGHVEIKMPGGCYLGPRPIDLHLKGFEALGAKVEYIKGCYILDADKLTGTNIFLDISSVGATINIMMAAVYAEGRTVIENAAREPEIIDIATLLNKMGARIHGMGTSTLTIDGVDRLGGCMHEIIPDRIEASTYLIIAAAMAKKMRIENIIPQHVDAITMKLKEIGIKMKIESDAIEVYESKDLLKPTDILTKPYPGFATDVQQPFTALLTKAQGQSVVTETIYTERFKHCYELNKMGADIDVRVPSSFINGPTPLYGTSVTATDLRCGACLVIAALMAEGVTEIHDVYHIDRGYEDLDGKLKSLGANLWREFTE